MDEMVQAGRRSVPGSIERYEYGKRLLSGFVGRRALGAMQDERRDMDPLSRTDRSQLRTIANISDPDEFQARLQELIKPSGSGHSRPFPMAAYLLTGDGGILSPTFSIEETKAKDNEAGDDRQPFELKSEEDVFDSVLKEAKIQRLNTALDLLPERERNVVCWLFGLRGQKQMVNSEIGHHMGVSKSRVSQLKTQSLKRLSMLMTEQPSAA